VQRIHLTQDTKCLRAFVKQSKNVKRPLYRLEGNNAERRYSFYSFLTSVLDGVSGQCHAPVVLTP
jgi:hypothetical protein